MAPKKKSSSASARQTEDTQALILVPERNQTGNEDVEVEDAADGQFEVRLEQMECPRRTPQPTKGSRQRLAKVRTRLRQAARAAQPSTSQMQTRSKRTVPEGVEKEDMNQYRQLQEDELCCQLLQQQIQEKRRLLELCHPEDDDTAQTDSPLPPRRHLQELRVGVLPPRPPMDTLEMVLFSFSVAAGGTHSMVSSKEVTSGHGSCHGLLAYDKALGASVIRSGGKSHQKLRHGTSNRSLCIFLSLLIAQHIVGQLQVVMLSTTVLKVEHCWIFLFLLAASTLCN
ncbi:hypothetical protein GQ55_1G440100 [Panicum hallii var. hallii]|uniref:Uncharacterized protein n=1 Tax=Panicum hallii var. hallii TaxID=1504633 RepID=A0A2T7FDW4_9POAL|nr:hypothetical protein GQ55_1G440100 [Panicum hallii var. hallii]